MQRENRSREDRAKPNSTNPTSIKFTPNQQIFLCDTPEIGHLSELLHEQLTQVAQNQRQVPHQEMNSLSKEQEPCDQLILQQSPNKIIVSIANNHDNEQNKYEDLIWREQDNTIFYESNLNEVSVELYSTKVTILLVGSFQEETKKKLKQICKVVQTDLSSLQFKMNEEAENKFSALILSKTPSIDESIVKSSIGICYCHPESFGSHYQKKNVFEYRNEEQLNEIGIQQLREFVEFSYTTKQLPNFSSIHQNTIKTGITRLNMAWILNSPDENIFADLFVSILEFNEHRSDVKLHKNNLELIQKIKNQKEELEQKCNFIKAYTKESILYQLINRGLRNFKLPQYLPYIKYPVSRIFNQVKKLCLRQAKKGKFASGMEVFRGCQFTKEQVQILEDSVGQEIQLQGFVSTSQRQAIAEGFDEVNQFKIIIPPLAASDMEANCFGSGFFADITNYSVKSEQCEVLFTPLNRFKVIKVQKQGAKLKVTLELVLQRQKYTTAKDPMQLLKFAQIQNCQLRNELMGYQWYFFFQFGMISSYREFCRWEVNKRIANIQKDSILFQKDELLGELSNWIDSLPKNNKAESEIEKLSKIEEIFSKYFHENSINEPFFLVKLLLHQLIVYSSTIKNHCSFLFAEQLCFFSKDGGDINFYSTKNDFIFLIDSFKNFMIKKSNKKPLLRKLIEKTSKWGCLQTQSLIKSLHQFTKQSLFILSEPQIFHKVKKQTKEVSLQEHSYFMQNKICLIELYQETKRDYLKGMFSTVVKRFLDNKDLYISLISLNQTSFYAFQLAEILFGAIKCDKNGDKDNHKILQKLRKIVLCHQLAKQPERSNNQMWAQLNPLNNEFQLYFLETKIKKYEEEGFKHPYKEYKEQQYCLFSFRLGRIYLRIRQIQQARITLFKAKETAEKQKPRYGNILWEIYKEIGVMFKLLREYQKSMQYLFASLQAFSNFGDPLNHFKMEILHQIGSLYAQTGNQELARHYFESAFALQPFIYYSNSAQIFELNCSWAKLMALQGNFQEAEKHMMIAAEKITFWYDGNASKKLNISILCDLGERILKAEIKEQMQWYLDLIHRQKNVKEEQFSCELLLILVQILLQLKKDEEAKKMFLQAQQKLEPDDIHFQTHFQIAMFYEKQGKKSNAFSHLQSYLKLLEQNKKLPEETRKKCLVYTVKLLGDLYLRNREMQKAVDQYKRSLQIIDESEESLKWKIFRNLGNALFYLNSFEQSLNFLIKALRMKQNNSANLCGTITKIYHIQSQSQMSLKYFKMWIYFLKMQEPHHRRKTIKTLKKYTQLFVSILSSDLLNKAQYEIHRLRSSKQFWQLRKKLASGMRNKRVRSWFCRKICEAIRNRTLKEQGQV